MFERGFKAKANRIAVDVRRDLGLPPEAPIDPWKVCAYYEIDVIRLSEFGELASHFLSVERDAFSAVTVSRGLRRAIVHNDRHVPWRQRSNLTHEIAHSLLGHVSMPALTTQGERNFDGQVEAEAHFLGGALLITNEAAWHIVREDLYDDAHKTYGTSHKMLDYRLRVSGALKRAEYLRRSAPAPIG
jgi:hypothetical protein